MSKSKRDCPATLLKTKKKWREHKETVVSSIMDAVEKYSSVYVFAFENMGNLKFKEFRHTLKSSRLLTTYSILVSMFLACIIESHLLASNFLYWITLEHPDTLSIIFLYVGAKSPYDFPCRRSYLRVLLDHANRSSLVYEDEMQLLKLVLAASLPPFSRSLLHFSCGCLRHRYYCLGLA
ncbi:hypothetical protein RND81_12G029100 [Saponaria officinalis]|uniref:Uncharacterized protein n=1 Tax=Saponaria officinalis TaxID=3572 RepID=A0AAW1H2J0_SAPOF